MSGGGQNAAPTGVFVEWAALLIVVVHEVLCDHAAHIDDRHVHEEMLEAALTLAQAATRVLLVGALKEESVDVSTIFAALVEVLDHDRQHGSLE